jgi:hypothetical protein
MSKDWSLHLFGLGLVGAIGATAFLADRDVPVLSALNLGSHELGHMVASAVGMPDLANAMMGPLLQIVAPVLATIAIILIRRDLFLASCTAAWAAVSLAETARYVADAPVGAIEHLGGEQDFALILGSDHLDLLARSGELAELVEAAGIVTMAASITFMVGGLVLATGEERRQRLLRAVPVRPLDWTPPPGFRPPSGRRVHAK